MKKDSTKKRYRKNIFSCFKSKEVETLWGGKDLVLVQKGVNTRVTGIENVGAH